MIIYILSVIILTFQWSFLILFCFFNSKILEVIKTYNDKHLWVGISRNTINHQWKLLDGTPAQDWVLNWYPGEPNNHENNGENCAHVIATTSQLNDENCYTNSSKFVYKSYFYGLCEQMN